MGAYGAEHGRGEVLGDWLAAGQPVSERSVGKFEEFLEGIEFGIGKSGDAGGDVATDHDVVLVGAPMVGTEQETAASGVEEGWHGWEGYRLNRAGCQPVREGEKAHQGRCP